MWKEVWMYRRMNIMKADCRKNDQVEIKAFILVLRPLEVQYKAWRRMAFYNWLLSSYAVIISLHLILQLAVASSIDCVSLMQKNEEQNCLQECPMFASVMLV